MKNILLLVFVFANILGLAQTNWYVDYQNGSNSNSGNTPNHAIKTVDYLVSNNMINAGDTVFIMGQYNNPSYDPDFTYGGNSDRNNPHIWTGENTIKLQNLNGNKNHYIIFKPYDENTVLKGDGANIIRVVNCSYLKIEGFEIYGEVEHIPLSEAEGLETDGMQFLYLDPNTNDIHYPTLQEVLFRVEVGTTIEEIENMTFPIIGPVIRPSYIDTKGLYVSNSHHLIIKGNLIHHMPGGGLRVASSSNVIVENNEVHDCSRRSYSGTHALVITKTTKGTTNSGDDPVYKVIVRNNEIHHNYNEIFSWVGTKDFITPRIDEGKGISLQRNNINEWQNGSQRILVENNLCYWNGFSGVHSNDGYHVDFINNTCYMNSYTNTVTYANDVQKGQNIGISTQRGNDIRIYNNISVIDTDWGGYAIAASNSTGLVVSDNLIYGVNGIPAQDPDITAIATNTIVSDPEFVDPENFDFNISENSPAVGAANTQFAPETDFYGNERDNEPDLGAIEYLTTSVVNNETSQNKLDAYPNPFSDKIILKSDFPLNDIAIFNLLGKDVTPVVYINRWKNKAEIETSKLKNGVYLLRSNGVSKIIVKK